jgi:hypothetical protein
MHPARSCMCCSRAAQWIGRPGARALLLASIFALEARAQPTAEEVALAEQLFREGRRLMDQADYAHACPKLEESHRLDPAGGTLLNLGACYEAAGKLASAWAKYNEALATARQDRRVDRIEVATERLQRLEPRLARLTLKVSASGDVPGLVIKLDETELGRASRGVPMPVDLGVHTVTATAPGKRVWTTQVTIQQEGETKTAVVPGLLDQVRDSPPPQAQTPAPPAHPAGALRRDPDRPALERTSATRTTAYAVGAAGLVGLAVGGYFGVRALQLHAQSEAECPAHRCTDRGAELSAEAVHAANVANVTLAIGLSAVATAVVLWLISEPRAANPAPRQSTGLHGGSQLCRAGGGPTISGRF